MCESLVGSHTYFIITKYYPMIKILHNIEAPYPRCVLNHNVEGECEAVETQLHLVSIASDGG